MREIKFRVFFQGNFTYFDFEKIAMESEAFFNNEIKNNTVEQFTGLLDKNGKEIYEGDLVRVDDGDGWILEESAPIKFSNGSFHVMNDFIDGRIVEIIGNIHQNPELLT